MNRLKQVILTLIVIFFASACGTNFVEQSSLTIVDPKSTDRVINDAVTPGGELVPLDVVVRLDSNRTDGDIFADLFINNELQEPCLLKLNTVTTCQVKLRDVGIQELRVEIKALDGTVIQTSRTFVWKPVGGIEIPVQYFAKLFNSDSPTDGFVYLGIATLILFGIIVLIKSKQDKLTTILVSIFFCYFVFTIIYAYFIDPIQAISMFNSLVAVFGGLASSVIVAYVITTFANRNYALRFPNRSRTWAKAWYPESAGGNPMLEIQQDNVEGLYFGDAAHLPDKHTLMFARTAAELRIIRDVFGQARHLIQQHQDPFERDRVIDLLPVDERPELRLAVNQIESGQISPFGEQLSGPIVTTTQSGGLLSGLRNLARRLVNL